MAVDITKNNFIPYSAGFEVSVEQGVSQDFFADVTVVGISMIESLRSQSIETVIHIQSPISSLYSKPFKNWDELRGKRITIKASNPNVILLGKPEMKIEQTIYRLEGRKPLSEGADIEFLKLRACDHTVINNQFSRISKPYSCKTPTYVVEDVLNCVQPTSTNIEQSIPTRNYHAANIHPFQVIAEQTNVALTNDEDPSFLHFMTFRNGGEHNFRSLRTMAQQTSAFGFVVNDPGFAGEFTGNPTTIMKYEFPCDFDLLTDILNGIDDNGDVSSSVVAFNPFDGSLNMVGGNYLECSGFGNPINDEVMSDDSTDNNCGAQIEKFQMKRQARMSLIHEDKIALRMWVPYNHAIFAGDIISIKIPNDYDINGPGNYGSGEYMIVKLSHEISSGGNGMTIIDAVSQTVGQGTV